MKNSDCRKIVISNCQQSAKRSKFRSHNNDVTLWVRVSYPDRKIHRNQ